MTASALKASSHTHGEEEGRVTPELRSKEEEISQDWGKEGILPVDRKREAVRTHLTRDGGRRQRGFTQQGVDHLS